MLKQRQYYNHINKENPNRNLLDLVVKIQQEIKEKIG